MRMKPPAFNPVLGHQGRKSIDATFAGTVICGSCERPVSHELVDGATLPGLVDGALCLDCLDMAAHELLLRAARAL